MDLQLRQIIPTYFNENRKQSSEIWGKDLVFSKGEYIKIVAPSGSGKTSLIHFLYGMRKEYKGRIHYDQAELGTLSPESVADLRKDHISVVFQDMRLFLNQSVFENLEIKRQLNPFHPAEMIAEMATRLGIGDKLQSKCLNCSYGEQQRIAIIRALMQPFDILLLDEPFSHLDNNNSKIAMELMIEESKKRNATIIFADLERIEFFPWTKIYHL
jgi:ABC-type lipoprotein export system ATPase subunit